MSKLFVFVGLFCLVAIAKAQPLPEEEEHENSDPEFIKDVDNLEPYIRPVDFQKLNEQPCSQATLEALVGRFEDAYRHLNELSESRLDEVLEPVSFMKTKNECGDQLNSLIDEIIEKYADDVIPSDAEEGGKLE